MGLPDTIVLDIPNLLTAGGVFVALLSAVYSARSAAASRRQAVAAEAALAEAKVQSAAAKGAVTEAQRQNRIAIHGERLEIYKALLDFRVQLATDRLNISKEKIWGFHNRTAWAALYFPAKIANALHDLVNAALKLSEAKVMAVEDGTNSTEDTPTIQTEFSRLFLAVETLNGEIFEELILAAG
jgi:hypothetical protein